VPDAIANEDSYTIVTITDKYPIAIPKDYDGPVSVYYVRSNVAGTMFLEVAGAPVVQHVDNPTDLLLTYCHGYDNGILKTFVSLTMLLLHPDLPSNFFVGESTINQFKIHHVMAALPVAVDYLNIDPTFRDRCHVTFNRDWITDTLTRQLIPLVSEDYALWAWNQAAKEAGVTRLLRMFHKDSGTSVGQLMSDPSGDLPVMLCPIDQPYAIGPPLSEIVCTQQDFDFVPGLTDPGSESVWTYYGNSQRSDPIGLEELSFAGVFPSAEFEAAEEGFAMLGRDGEAHFSKKPFSAGRRGREELRSRRSGIGLFDEILNPFKSATTDIKEARQINPASRVRARADLDRVLSKNSPNYVRPTKELPQLDRKYFSQFERQTGGRLPSTAWEAEPKRTPTVSTSRQLEGSVKSSSASKALSTEGESQAKQSKVASGFKKLGDQLSSNAGLFALSAAQLGVAGVQAGTAVKVKHMDIAEDQAKLRAASEALQTQIQATSELEHQKFVEASVIENHHT